MSLSPIILANPQDFSCVICKSDFEENPDISLAHDENPGHYVHKECAITAAKYQIENKANPSCASCMKVISVIDGKPYMLSEDVLLMKIQEVVTDGALSTLPSMLNAPIAQDPDRSVYRTRLLAAFAITAKMGLTVTVNALLQMEEVIALPIEITTEIRGIAARFAAKHGHVETLRVLLQDCVISEQNRDQAVMSAYTYQGTAAPGNLGGGLFALLGALASGGKVSVSTQALTTMSQMLTILLENGSISIEQRGKAICHLSSISGDPTLQCNNIDLLLKSGPISISSRAKAIKSATETNIIKRMMEIPTPQDTPKDLVERVKRYVYYRIVLEKRTSLPVLHFVCERNPPLGINESELKEGNPLQVLTPEDRAECIRYVGYSNPALLGALISSGPIPNTIAIGSLLNLDRMKQFETLPEIRTFLNTLFPDGKYPKSVLDILFSWAIYRENPEFDFFLELLEKTNQINEFTLLAAVDKAITKGNTEIVGKLLIKQSITNFRITDCVGTAGISGNREMIRELSKHGSIDAFERGLYYSIRAIQHKNYLASLDIAIKTIQDTAFGIFEGFINGLE